MIYKYKPVTIGKHPNTATLMVRNNDNNTMQEIAIIGDWRYVHAPNDADIPEQWPEIEWQAVVLSDELKEEIKANSRPCLLISERMQAKIREKYTAEDEMYFARIGTGKALGVYEFQQGEEAALLQYGNFVESVRQWGREQRALIGL